MDHLNKFVLKATLMLLGHSSVGHKTQSAVGNLEKKELMKIMLMLRRKTRWHPFCHTILMHPSWRQKNIHTINNFIVSCAYLVLGTHFFLTRRGAL